MRDTMALHAVAFIAQAHGCLGQAWTYPAGNSLAAEAFAAADEALCLLAAILAAEAAGCRVDGPDGETNTEGQA